MKLAKALEVDMNFSVTAPVNDKRESKKPKTYTIAQSFEAVNKRRLASPGISEDDNGAAGINPGSVAQAMGEPVAPDSPEFSLPAPTNLFRRTKKMARRLDESDDEGTTEGVSRATSASPVPAGASRATTPAGPAAPVSEPASVSVSPAAASMPASTAALPMAVAVEYIPRNVDNAVMYMELDRVEARFKALDGRIAELEETNRVLTSNEAVYQIAYAQVEARLKEKDEMHAELFKSTQAHHAELIRITEAHHVELMKAQVEIGKLKEEKYLAIIKENADRFMQLTKEKDDKYNDMFNANYDLARAKDEIIENLQVPRRNRTARRPE